WVHPTRVLDDAFAARALVSLRVDEHFLPAARSAEVALPGALDARRADAIALGVARAPKLLQLLGVDLGHVAEHVCADLVVRVVAHRHGGDLDSRKLRLVRLVSRDRVARDVLLEQDLLALPGAIIRAQGREVLLEPRALLDADAQVIDELGPRRRHVE